MRFFLRRPWPSIRPRRAFTLLEVLVCLVVLLTGIIGIASFFPTILKQNRRAMDVSMAAYFAQQKVEEIRRDNNASGALISRIRAMTTPSQPIAFPSDPRLAYSLNGLSLLDRVDDADDPRDDPGVARIIVRYAAGYRPQQEILYELRFDE